MIVASRLLSKIRTCYWVTKLPAISTYFNCMMVTKYYQSVTKQKAYRLLGYQATSYILCKYVPTVNTLPWWLPNVTSQLKQNVCRLLGYWVTRYISCKYIQTMNTLLSWLPNATSWLLNKTSKMYVGYWTTKLPDISHANIFHLWI